MTSSSSHPSTPTPPSILSTYHSVPDPRARSFQPPSALGSRYHHRSQSDTAQLARSPQSMDASRPVPPGLSRTSSRTSASSPPLPVTTPLTPADFPIHRPTPRRHHSHQSHHLRCSPDCFAAEAPYRLLATAIGRASTVDSRSVLQKAGPSRSYPPLGQPRRPSLQSRRSRNRTSTLGTEEQANLKPLAFDAKQFQLTPPIPPAERFLDPTTVPEFFADLEEIPRSSSAPAVPTSPRQRSASGDPPKLPHTHSTHHPYTGFEKSVETLLGDPLDLVAYLGPELAATFKQRFDPNGHVQRKHSQKQETSGDADWSFNVPVSHVVRLAIEPLLRDAPATNLIQIAEFGCTAHFVNPTLQYIAERVAASDRQIIITHQCPHAHDIRQLQASLKSAYSRSSPVSTYFTFSGFGETVFPPSSIDFAIGGSELSKVHGLYAVPQRRAISRERLAEQEFTSWLQTRADEVKPGGWVALSIAVRHQPVELARTLSSRSLDTMSSSPTYAAGPPLNIGTTSDLWLSVHHALSRAVQRLVSLGEIRPHVAPALVDAPYWPRTVASVKETLRTVESQWEVVPPVDEEGDVDMAEADEWKQAGVRVHRVTHPAWTALQTGNIDRTTYANRVATYVRQVHEGHIKLVLREKAKMDIAQTEATVQELFKILEEKCELGALDALALDVGVLVLRRKP